MLELMNSISTVTSQVSNFVDCIQGRLLDAGFVLGYFSKIAPADEYLGVFLGG